MRYQSVFATSATSVKSGKIPGWILLLSCSNIFLKTVIPRKYSYWVLLRTPFCFAIFQESGPSDSPIKRQPLFPDSGGHLPVTEPFSCDQAVYSWLNFDTWRPNLLPMTTPLTHDQVRMIWVWVGRVRNVQVRKVPMRKLYNNKGL